jgi:hypothetical protein
MRERLIHASINLINVEDFGTSTVARGLMEVRYDWKNNGKLENAFCEQFIANYHPSKKETGKYKFDLKGVPFSIYYLGELSKFKKEGERIIFSQDFLDSIWNGISQHGSEWDNFLTGNLLNG